MDQSRILKFNEEAEEEVAEPGFWSGARDKLDRFLQKKVADPFTSAGYGDVGAGLAAGVSTVADFGLPQDRKVDQPLGAEGLFVQLGDGPKRPLEQAITLVKQQLKDSPQEMVEAAIKRLRAQARPEPGVSPALLQRQSKAGEALNAFYTKPKVDATVHDASSIKNLPQAKETARTRDTVITEYMKRGK